MRKKQLPQPRQTSYRLHVPERSRAIAFGISVLPDVNIHGTMGRFWSSSTANSTRFFHEHGLTVSNAIPLQCDGERRQGGQGVIISMGKYNKILSPPEGEAWLETVDGLK